MSRWALLIGVNFYPTQPLKGCVNDIKLIKRYAESNVPSSQISALTATTPEQPGSKGLTGDPAEWPTLSNIREHLTKILSLSDPGDQVLIHYSGHGDRMLSPKNPSPHVVADHHVALVVLNEDATDTADLQGIVLAGYINRMVEKGLLVSLVLDCCFSGAVYRENCEPNSAVRTLIKASGQGEPTTSTGQRGKTSNIFRDAHTLPSWIVDPDGYMVIAACGPHEIARERQFDGKWHGVLSYHLHETLKFMEGQGGSISYHTFLNNLVTKVHTRSRQTPMSYGNLRRFFFEGVSSDYFVDLVPVSRVGSQLILETGLAHGVSQGDTYAVYPFHIAENEIVGLSDSLFNTQVSSVGPLTSTLQHDGLQEPTTTSVYGLKARLITSNSSRKPQLGLVGDSRYKNRLMQAARNQPFFHLPKSETATGPYDFSLHFLEENKCLLLDGTSQPIVSLASFPIGPDHDLRPLVRTLCHLARFKYFEGITTPNPEQALRSKFTLELKKLDGGSYDLDKTIDVVEGTQLELAITNIDPSSTLYVTILNFTPVYQIHCLTAHLNNSGACVIPPRDIINNFPGIDNVAWEMQVPETCRAKGNCQDTIKVIVSNQATSFNHMFLPEINDLQGGLGRNTQTLTTATSRGSIHRQFHSSNKGQEVVIITFGLKTLCH